MNANRINSVTEAAFIVRQHKSNVNTQPDTVAAVIPTLDLDADYLRLKEAGVTFLGEPQYIEAWGMRCTYFRDPEGNLFELNDASNV